MIVTAIFSDSMCVGMLVLPREIVGISDASMTRNPSKPRTFPAVSVTAVRSFASVLLRQVPTGWKMVVPTLPAAVSISASD